MHFKMWSAICFSLDQLTILSPGNGLRVDTLSLSYYNNKYRTGNKNLNTK